MKAIARLALLCLLCVPARAADAPSETYPGIRADPRYELFAVVQLLAGADKRFSGFHRHDIPYDHAAEAHFAPFKRHPVVDRYAELTAKGFTYIKAYNFLFALGDPPGLELRETVPDPFLELMGGTQGAEEFRLLLKDFARVSGFMEFYARTAPEREGFVKEVRDQARGLDCRAALKDYTGLPVKTRYTIIVSPFAEPALSMNIVRPDPDGTTRVTTIYGAEDFDGRFQFRLATRMPQVWHDVVLEELLADAQTQRAALEKSSALLEPIGSECAPNWYECAQRHISFAVGARMLDRAGEKSQAAEWPIKYARIGLPYLAPLMDALKDYERHRDRYPTLLDFYPRLIEVFDALAAGRRSALSFSGDISKAMADPGPAVLILPERLAPELRTRVEELRKLRWSRAVALTDRQALSTNLTGKALVVIGTAEDNLWIARRYDDLHLPGHLAADGITFNARPGEKEPLRISGKLGFVTTALNPSDVTRPVVLYMAADEQTIGAALDGNPWPADFVVLDGKTAVKLGTYEKSRVPWRLK